MYHSPAATDERKHHGSPRAIRDSGSSRVRSHDGRPRDTLPTGEQVGITQAATRATLAVPRFGSRWQELRSPLSGHVPKRHKARLHAETPEPETAKSMDNSPSTSPAEEETPWWLICFSPRDAYHQVSGACDQNIVPRGRSQPL